MSGGKSTKKKEPPLTKVQREILEKLSKDVTERTKWRLDMTLLMTTARAELQTRGQMKDRAMRERLVQDYYWRGYTVARDNAPRPSNHH